eukprot:TRINITY_DN2647_c0_g1_i1.p1 TRINITY_DN2647_c0_g1~~TRINITY_DN2647_c0_g1_i1.p1  ORF type:complete len:114 (-),score=16.59 TRINITY_DN2647_c0_g1_i1:1153-1494(-)
MSQRNSSNNNNYGLTSSPNEGNQSDAIQQNRRKKDGGQTPPNRGFCRQAQVSWSKRTILLKQHTSSCFRNYLNKYIRRRGLVECRYTTTLTESLLPLRMMIFVIHNTNCMNGN